MTADSPRKERIIRWKSVLPGAITLVVAFVFVAFFLDWTIEWAIERAGTMANGAKVELAGVDINWIKGSITLRRLQITDKSAPMTNAFEIDSMKFAISPKPLFWRKFIIETGEINGIRSGTPRKYSGAIPETPADEAAPGGKTAAKGKGREKAGGKSEGPGLGKEALSFLKGNIGDQFNADLLKPEDLASYRKVQEEKARINNIAAGWEGQVDGLKTEGVTSEAEALIAKVKAGNYSGIEGAKQAAADLKDAQRIQGEVAKLQANVNSTRNSISNEINATKDTLGQIDALKKQDMDTVMKLGGSLFSAEGLTRAVLGPQWTGKIDYALEWFRNIRGFMPKKEKAAKAAPPPLRQGRDIEFVFKYKWPTFHLKKATISGTTSGDSPIEYQGTLTDVTSDPVIVGRPIVLAVAGSSRGGARSMRLNATLDYTKEKAREAVKFNYSGMALGGASLGNLAGPAGIKSGSGAISCDLEANGDAVAGQIVFNAKPVKLSHELSKDAAKQKLLVALHDAIVGMDQLQITFLVSGKLKSPKIGIKSSMDRTLQNAVNAAVKKEIEAVRAKYQAKINGMVDGEKAKLTALVNENSKKALGRLGIKADSVDSAKAQLEKTIADLKEQGKAGASKLIPAGVPATLPKGLPKGFKK